MPKVVLRTPAKATDLVVNMNDEEVPLEKLDGEIWVNPGQRRIYAKGKIEGRRWSSSGHRGGRVRDGDHRHPPRQQEPRPR